MLDFDASVVQQLSFHGRLFYLKRDDFVHKDFNGNKARKFYSLLNSDLSAYDTVISHGSIQSNAMYSLSVLAREKGLDFVYYVSHIPSLLQKSPVGNYRYALQNGMRLQVAPPPESTPPNALFIPEGGACGYAKDGIRLLAAEIESWARHNGFEKLDVFLPSGTGTTALYLQKYCRFDIHTCACVGDETYLRKQWAQLEVDHYPNIVPTRRKYHFGKLYPHLFGLWQEVKAQTGVEFDLLYDPIGLETMLSFSFTHPVLYLHQGGLIGNETMLARYERKLDLSVGT